MENRARINRCLCRLSRGGCLVIDQSNGGSRGGFGREGGENDEGID